MTEFPSRAELAAEYQARADEADDPLSRRAWQAMADDLKDHPQHGDPVEDEKTEANE